MEAAKPMAQIPLPPPASRQRLSALSGLRVIDFSTSIAGPYGSQCLADLGAEVVKIERTESGDDSRQWGPPLSRRILAVVSQCESEQIERSAQS